jgi:hypothetical protein
MLIKWMQAIRERMTARRRRRAVLRTIEEAVG